MISPQLPAISLEMRAQMKLAFDLLFDVGNKVAEAYGIAMQLPDDLINVYASRGIDLPTFDGDEAGRRTAPRCRRGRERVPLDCLETEVYLRHRHSMLRISSSSMRSSCSAKKTLMPSSELSRARQVGRFGLTWVGGSPVRLIIVTR